MGYLEDAHIDKIFQAYTEFQNSENFASLVTKDDLAENRFNMAINLYVRPEKNDVQTESFSETLEKWQQSSDLLKRNMEELFSVL